MKKLNLVLFYTLLILIMPCNAFASNTSESKETINLSKATSLSLTYKYDDLIINNANVKIYKIADVSKDYQYTLTNDFSSYPIVLNGVKTKDELKSIASTLESYIYADGIKETASNTIINNNVSFDSLSTGLYLVLTENIEHEKYTLVFETFLMSLPNLNEDGTWNYDVAAKPKPEYYEPKYEEVTYKVIKEWKDTGNNRPTSVKIEIYKDKELYENVTLSKENNWTHSFNALDDGSIFTVVEREIPKDYTVSIKKNERTYIVVNTLEEDNPNTVDNIYIYLILFIGSFSGILVSLITLNKFETRKIV